MTRPEEVDEARRALSPRGRACGWPLSVRLAARPRREMPGQHSRDPAPGSSVAVAVPEPSAVTRVARNPDLHGSAPDKAAVALILIDVINDLGFDGGLELLKPALEMTRALRPLAARARRLGIPVVYVNDNWGRWRSDFRQLVRHCGAPRSRGRRLVKALAPDPKDYFVLKPKHSGFFATGLETLLTYLGTETLVLTGLTADNCVLFTASDAYVRDFRLHVPQDCVAAATPRARRQALAHMHRVLRADTRVSTDIDLARLLRPDGGIPAKT